MALVNVIDAATVEATLPGWLSERMPEASEVSIADLRIPQASGMSMTTVLFSASWTRDGRRETQRYVARVAPTGEGVFKRNDLVREFRLLSALDPTPVRVPTPFWVEERPDVFGSPFMVVAHVEGRVPADDPPFTTEGWVLELPEGERGKLVDGALQTIADVHAVDWQGLGLGDVLDEPEFGPLGLGQQIRHWQDTYAWASGLGGGGSPTIDAAFVWAVDNQPAEEELVLNWGDARLGNLIFGDDLSVAAVLDWEMASIGSPQVDVGWTTFIMRYLTDAIGVVLPAGLPTRAEIIERYQALTGRALPDVDYYEAFSALKLSILFLRLSTVMIVAGKLPRDSVIGLNNPASQILADLLGLPAPAGELENYVGRR
jgi:aminoglycoside phosphotransferase (APT) family kinase protein